MESATQSQLELLEERIEYSDTVFSDTETYENVLQRLLEDSKYVGLSLRFPYQDKSSEDLPERYNNWQLRCCEELYKLIGTANIKSYAENGLNWTRDSGYLSTHLINEIEPIVGYIQSETEEE